MIVLVHIPSECARSLHYFSQTKMYRQRRRVVYQNLFTYDLVLLFIMAMEEKLIILFCFESENEDCRNLANVIRLSE